MEAIVADPGYPLAQFNLGNLYDEQGRIKEAFEYYRRAWSSTLTTPTPL